MNTAPSAHASVAADGFDSITVLFILLIGSVVVFSLIVYLCSSLARRERPPHGLRLWLRGGAVLGCCAALCVYLWGLLHVVFMEDTNMREACVKSGGGKRAATVDGYGASYVPLRFTCRIDEGGSYAAAVPPWINPALSVLVPLTLITGVASGVTRDDLRRSTAPPTRRE
ncbi:hypothetical protein [Streptomyces longisporoflavus]|uniref:Integral membrane protein n=1 Tax=Streptomyces longisporoflavus TaxID=28044 RepID=A0ABW7R300_9ACTN